MNTPARIPYDACPLCQGQEAQVKGTYDCSRHALWRPSLPRAVRWLRCGACGHVFTDGYFNDAACAVLFSSGHAGQTPGHDPTEGRAVAAPIVEAVSALRGQPAPQGRWLDVGFGAGALLTTAEEFGYQVVGLDLRKSAVALLREWGYEAHQKDLGEYQADAPFDVISLADVLEHMPFPVAALRRVRDLLRDGGLLFLSMPNQDAFVWKDLDKRGKNPYWTEIEHYHNFGRRRLYELLSQEGFAPCRYAVSGRYVACMEVIARRQAAASP